MTIRDLLDAGIQIQGNKIFIREINGDEIISRFSTESELLPINNNCMDLEIKYIYPLAGSLVIEVG